VFLGLLLSLPLPVLLPVLILILIASLSVSAADCVSRRAMGQADKARNEEKCSTVSEVLCFMLYRASSPITHRGALDYTIRTALQRSVPVLT
jgi:hypothetical protein